MRARVLLIGWLLAMVACDDARPVPAPSRQPDASIARDATGDGATGDGATGDGATGTDATPADDDASAADARRSDEDARTPADGAQTADAAIERDASGAEDARERDDASGAEDARASDAAPQDAAALPDAAPRPDAGPADPCAAAPYLGTCITRRIADNVVTDCRDYFVTPNYPSAGTIATACPANNGAVARTWASAPCPHTTSVGGCHVASPIGAECYAQTDWYYPPSTASSAQAACVNAGRTFVPP